MATTVRNEELLQQQINALDNDLKQTKCESATAQTVLQTCLDVVNSLDFLNMYDMCDLLKTLLAFRDRQAVKPRYVGKLGEEIPCKL